MVSSSFGSWFLVLSFVAVVVGYNLSTRQGLCFELLLILRLGLLVWFRRMANGEEKNNDFYAVLGLNKECTPTELRTAYKKLALVRVLAILL